MDLALYIRTENTLLSSLIRIKELISFAQENNIKALAITDDSLYGAIEFYNACKKAQIKPIIGMSITIEKNTILLYAKNYSGYQNLLKLETIHSERKLSLEDLQNYKDNLICIVPFESLLFYDALQNFYKDIFKSYKNEEERKQLTGENFLFARETLYLKKEEATTYTYLTCIQDGSTLNSKKLYHPNNHFILPSEIKSTFPQDYHNYEKIFHLCNLTIETRKNLLPIYPCPNQLDSYTYLKKLCIEGLKKLFGETAPKLYLERLKHELSVIQNMGFCNYFLVVWDYVKYAKENDILVGPGRGSAAGSLVAYLLNITTIDPIRYQLLFERFLNPMRITLPDIDIDFEYTKREQVVKYCIQKYGEKNVAPIIAFGTLGARQAVRDIGRVMDIPLKQIDSICKMMDSKYNLEANYNQNYKLRDYLDSDPNLTKMYEVAKKVEGLKRHTTIHAAGIVMSEIPLDTVIPLHKNNEYYLTGYSMEYLEELGLLKMDFLALRNLTMIADILKEIHTDLTFDTIPFDDKAALSIFTTVNTMGIFQFESEGMKNFLRKFKPTTFEDIFAALALFRPGPMDNIDSYIRRKNKKEKIDYIHPDLQPILENTYGIIIYQEQIMSIASTMAGYSLGEADILRRAMSKKKEEVLLEEKDKFIKRAIEKGYQLEIATKVYDLILKFASYGFNRAHSVAYATISYRMAYLKAHYPLIFMKHLLNMYIGSPKTKEYIYEGKVNHVNVLKPDINESGMEYKVEENGIRYPFLGIKNVGVNTVTIILEERKKGKFKDMFDFLGRCYGKSVNTKIIESLIYAGCFDNFGLYKKTLIENLEIIINYGELVKDLTEEYALKPELENIEEYSNQYLMQKELEVFGFYLSNHPVTEYRIKKRMPITFQEIPNYFDQVINVIAYVDHLKEVETKSGEKMCFVTGSDEIATLDIVLFPRVYHDIELKPGDIIYARGNIEKRYDKYQMIVIRFEKLNEE